MMFHVPGLTTPVLLIAILSLSSSLAIGADDYPSRPIKLMVGASAFAIINASSVMVGVEPA